MTVADLVQLLQYAVAAGFILLGLASAATWARHRDRSHGWLAIALGLLGLTSLLGLLPRHLPALPQVSLVAFMASGYALVRFRACFLPLARGRLGAVGTVVVGATLLALLVPLPSGATPRYSAPQLAVAGLLVVVWSACVGEPAVRFWLASRRRPAVQRARLRALSGGYAGIVGVLFFAVAARSASAGVVIVVEVVALAIVPMLYAGLAPPRLLRLLWRERDEDSYRQATEELLLFAADTVTLMERALDWSTRLVGADAGVIASLQGEVLAARNLAAADADALALRFGGTAAPGPGMSPREGRLVVVPVVSEPEGATLIVVAGPFTPIFGSDEVASLQRYAALLALAMSGVHLYQGLLQNISDMGEGLVFSDEGGVTYANEAYARMTGYTQEELLGLASTMELAAPEDRERMARQRHDAFASGAGVIHNETQLITRDGRRIHIESVVRQRMVEGTTGTIAIVRDVTERKQTEEQLLQAQSRMQTIIDTSMNAIVTMDERGCITGWSSGATSIFGWEQEEAMGRNLAETIIPPHHRAAHNAGLALFLATGEGPVLGRVRDTVAIHRDGHEFPVELGMSKGSGTGQAVTFVGFLRDITDRKRAEAAQVSKSAITATLAGAADWAAAAPSVMGSICANRGWDLAEYWSVDAGGGIRREHAWHGTDSADLEPAGSDAGRALPGQARSTGTAAWGPDPRDGGNGGTHGAHAAVAFPIRNSEGTVGVMALYGRQGRQPDEDTEAALVDVGDRIADFLDRKSAETAIRTLNEELELRVAERTAEMEAFVYTVSHDLRTPLRAIDGFVAALVEDYRAELPAGAREFLDDVAANAKRMATLIEDLLAFSRLDRLLPRRQLVDPGEIAGQVMEQLKPALAGRQVDVAIDELPACSADPALLAQVYTNLLTNALKFSRTRDRTEIHVGSRSDAAGIAYFVKDNGVGFDPAYVDKLFGVFQRLHGAGEYEGTGVGLAIVQRIVRRHGGRAWAEGLPGLGATFFFRLNEVERHEGK